MIRREIPLGKQIHGNIYVHKSYITRMVDKYKLFNGDFWIDAYCKAVALAKISYNDYTILKWNERKQVMSFIYCPNFDASCEPHIESYVTVNLRNGRVSRRRYANNCPIYHHKWLMVEDNYPGFLVSREKMRSILIEKVLKMFPWIDKKMIGYLSYWQNEVVPKLLDERHDRLDASEIDNGRKIDQIAAAHNS